MKDLIYLFLKFDRISPSMELDECICMNVFTHASVLEKSVHEYF